MSSLLNKAIASLPVKQATIPARTIWDALVNQDIHSPFASYPKDIEEFGYVADFYNKAGLSLGDIAKASIVYPPLRAFLPHWDLCMTLYTHHKYDELWKKLDSSICPKAFRIEQEWTGNE